ncbi:Copper-transporting P-type ATPase [Chromobacterium violaceum]|uniref:P-type Zn(2+) transporter n=1 Tax=Chromobacterium violaceum TaxID=536 RepID=A0A447TC63_CHRVL|nr:Copper-transporting P-type ATPase [Chromobacterium violaceum]
MLADRFASWFVGFLLLAAAGSYIGWHFIDPGRALWIMVAVLVISCPCALSLATPAALTAASGRLASLGVLTTRGHALETLAKADDAVFDKTGTLTHGQMRLLETRGPLDAHRALAVAAALEQGSEHPLAQAILAAAPADRPQADGLINHPGGGVAGGVDGREWRLAPPPSSPPGWAAKWTRTPAGSRTAPRYCWRTPAACRPASPSATPAATTRRR